ncbi:hypothetical protein ADUPG1_000202 [Aduncisulcus paluster]|uniref:Uncharacterized protein n=1 Tax=Aduncisulcus paluster TaxID=2918883 RepID=A0ABQ5K5E4_9EUKA|nr:hypothetical protein ADUPG1_000202 [Aduncisulcus paluster]
MKVAEDAFQLFGISQMMMMKAIMPVGAGDHKKPSQMGRDMFAGHNGLDFTTLSIDFSELFDIYGVYICVEKGPPIFTFRLYKGEDESNLRIIKFNFSSEIIEESWFFLHLGVKEVDHCDIDALGAWEDPKRLTTNVVSMIFVREEREEEIKQRKRKEEEKRILIEKYQSIEPEFIHEGGRDSCPIKRDNPIIISLRPSDICGKDITEVPEKSDKSADTFEMWEGIQSYFWFSHMSFKFDRTGMAIKGIYICIDIDDGPPILLLKFTHNDESESLMICHFKEVANYMEWFYLPIDKDNVILCEIEGKGKWNQRYSKHSRIVSLFFTREETDKEYKTRRDDEEADEKLWKEAKLMTSHKSDCAPDLIPPVPKKDSLFPDLKKITATDVSFYHDGRFKDKSIRARRLFQFEEEDEIYFTHLSIPFEFPSSIGGVFLRLSSEKGPRNMLFILTNSSNVKTTRKYKLIRPTNDVEWWYFPVKCENVTLCEIRVKGKWYWKHANNAAIMSILFTKESLISCDDEEEETITIFSDSTSITIQSIWPSDMVC